MDRTIFVTTSDLSGTSGHNVATREIAAALVRHPGLSIAVICPTPIREFPDNLQNVPLYFLPRESTGVLDHAVTQAVLLPKLLLAIAEQNPDYLIARLAPSLVVPPLVSALLRIPYSLQIRGDVTRNIRLPRFVEAVAGLNVILADDIISELPSLHEKFVAPRRDDIGYDRTFNSAVDPNRFFPIDRSSARNRIKPEVGDDFVVGFVGSLKSRHMIGSLLDSLSMLRSKQAVVPQVLIVGEGPLQSDLKTQISSLNLEESVYLVGFIDHEKVVDYYAASDVIYGVVDPERPTNPLKCYEGLACGRPIITTNTPEFAFVEEVDAGIVLDRVAPDTIATSIERLREIPRTEREKMGMRGRQYVVANHTWDKLADMIVDGIGRE